MASKLPSQGSGRSGRWVISLRELQNRWPVRRDLRRSGLRFVAVAFDRDDGLGSLLQGLLLDIPAGGHLFSVLLDDIQLLFGQFLALALPDRDDEIIHDQFRRRLDLFDLIVCAGNSTVIGDGGRSWGRRGFGLGRSRL